jgi:hypothetical protein
MSRTLITRPLAILALGVFAGSLTGCAAQAEFNPVGQNTKTMTSPQLAAWAARADYPTTAPAGDELKMAAIVDKADKTIKLYNFTGQPIRDSKLWVNRAFVTRIDGIPPRSKAEVKYDRLYDGLGNTFESHKQDVSMVQLEFDGKVHDTLGPATE